MISSDYPMTFGYGRTDPPYGTAAYPYHRGDDYAMPEGTPIVINGVQIGISGHTGFVTGPHCHIGRFVGGKDTDPHSTGWTLTAPRVTNITYDDVNGNEVGLLDAAGVRWVYLHMRDLSTNVRVGDYLDQLPKLNEGEDVKPLRNQIILAYKLAFGPDNPPTEDQIQAQLGQPDLSHVLMSIEADSAKAWAAKGNTTLDKSEVLNYIQNNLG